MTTSSSASDHLFATSYCARTVFLYRDIEIDIQREQNAAATTTAAAAAPIQT